MIGPDGTHYLDDGRVEGTDPLAPFGPNTADHLRRTSSFDNCPDLLINSFFDPEADEGAAFEGLIGFHGGLGGQQQLRIGETTLRTDQNSRAPGLSSLGAQGSSIFFSAGMGDTAEAAFEHLGRVTVRF